MTAFVYISLAALTVSCANLSKLQLHIILLDNNQGMKGMRCVYMVPTATVTHYHLCRLNVVLPDVDRG